MTPIDTVSPHEPVLVVGSDPAEVSVVIAILGELGTAARSIDPERSVRAERGTDVWAGRADGRASIGALAIVLALDRDPDAEVWARSHHHAYPGAGLIALMDVIDGTTAPLALSVGARAVIAAPPSVEAVRRAVAEVEEWHLRLDSVGSGDAVPSGGSSLVVVGSKGGTGATTVAIEVACRLPGTVALVDLGEPARSIADRFGVAAPPDLAELAGVAAGLPARRISSGAVRLPVGPVLFGRGPAALDAPSMRRLIERIAEDFDHVVVDGGCGRALPTEAAVRVADQVLVVVNPDVASISGAQGLLARWEHGGVRRSDDCRVVLNRSDRSAELGRSVIARVMPAAVLDAAIPADYRRLEPLVNGSSSGPVDGAMGRAFDRLGVELVPGPRPGATGSSGRWATRWSELSKRWREVAGGLHREVGQSTVEVLVSLAVVLVALLAVAQVLGAGRSASTVHRAATQGSRAAALRAGEPGAGPAEIRTAAVHAVARECADSECVAEVEITSRSITVRVERQGASSGSVTDGDRTADRATASITVRR